MLKLNLVEHPRRAQTRLVIDRMTADEVLDLVDPGPLERPRDVRRSYCYLRLVA